MPFMFAIFRADELRSLAPIHYEVQIYESSDPIIESWLAGAAYARQPTFLHHVVTRAEYQESGSNACRRKFPGTERDELAELHEDTGRKAKTDRSKAKGKARANNDDNEGAKKPVRGSRSKATVTLG